MLIDSSYLVNRSRNDLGAEGMWIDALNNLKMHYGENPEYNTIVTGGITRELATLSDVEAKDEGGIPLVSIESILSLDYTASVGVNRHGLDLARELWRLFSSKAVRNEQPSSADLEIIYNVVARVISGSLTTVLTYDEDILGPARALKELYPYDVFFYQDQARPIHELTNSDKVMLIPADRLKEIYQITNQGGRIPSLTTANVPYLDESIDVVIDVGILSKKLSPTSSARQFPVWLFEALDSKAPLYKQRAATSRNDAAFKRVLSDMSKRGQSKMYSFFKSESTGTLTLQELNILTSKDEEVKWFSVTDKFLNNNLPATRNALASLRIGIAEHQR